MLTVVYSKDAQSEAKELVAAFEKKYKASKTHRHAVLVSEEQLRDWNTTASRLHASLAEVLSAAEVHGFSPSDVMFMMMLKSPELTKEFLKSLHFLRTVSLANPNLLAVGYRSFPSELSKLLATVSRNAQLIPEDYTFQSGDLMGTIVAICGATLEERLEEAEAMCQPLNG
ncbi:MAG: hypothetical protein ACK5PR_03710 [bacterium]